MITAEDYNLMQKGNASNCGISYSRIMIVSLYRNATLLQVVVTNGIDSEAPRAGNTGKRGFDLEA